MENKTKSAQSRQKTPNGYLNHFQFNRKFLDPIVKFLKKHDKFIITTHIGSDPDGLGSEIGIYYILKKLKKQVYIINAEKVPENYSFMAPDGLIKNTEQDLEEIQQMDLSGFVLLIMDNSEISRTGKILEISGKFKCPYASIDHHLVKKTKNFFVDASYAATSEIVWELFRYLKIPVSRDIAIMLYCGIIADTGNFRFTKTSFRTHVAGGDLVNAGANSDEIYRKLFESSPPDRLKLLRRILEKAIINTEKKYVVGFVKKEMFKKLKLGDTPTEGIVNQILSVRDIEISALMTETPNGDLKCSLRSIGEINVALLARKFGGGGHKNAAGLYIKGPFKRAAKKVIAEIEKALQ